MDPARPKNSNQWARPGQALDGLGDADIVARVIEGDTAAYEVLVARYTSLVRGYLLKRKFSREDMEDVFQEVFIAAYVKLAGLRNPARFGPWVVAIARNTAVNFRSASARDRQATRIDEGESVADHIVDGSPSPVERVSLRLMQSSVLDAIGELSDRYRVIVYMRLIDEVPLHEIAERLDLKESTVRMRLSRGLIKVRKKLQRAGVAPAGGE